jgi:hypothetical protein
MLQTILSLRSSIEQLLLTHEGPIYLGNTFSLGMLENDVEFEIKVVEVFEGEVRRIFDHFGYHSVVTSQFMATWYSNLLRIDVDLNDTMAKLKKGDFMIVGQSFVDHPKARPNPGEESELKWLLVRIS